MNENRIEIMHGVNFDVLEVRDAAVYGGLTLMELEVRVKGFAQDLGLEASFSQTNHEGQFCENLHRARETADGLILNPGAWTHYSYAIRDAHRAHRPARGGGAPLRDRLPRGLAASLGDP